VPVRVSARGIIIVDGRLLVQISKSRRWYRLPGGRVGSRETVDETVKRELEEELGVTVEPEKLVYIVESFYKRRGRLIHDVGFYYLCRMKGEPRPRESHLRIAWVEPSVLTESNFRPRALSPLLRRHCVSGFPGQVVHVVSVEV